METTSPVPLASPAAARRGNATLRALAHGTLSARQEGTLPAAGLLVLRVGTGGLVAWLHGLHKVQDAIAFLTTGRAWPLLADTVTLGLPAPVLWAAAAALGQLLGGILMAVGLLTRPAAAAVAATMAVAVWLNLATGGPDVQLAGVYGIAALSVALLGGGRFSLDAAWTRGAPR